MNNIAAMIAFLGEVGQETVLLTVGPGLGDGRWNARLNHPDGLPLFDKNGDRALVAEAETIPEALALLDELCVI